MPTPKDEIALSVMLESRGLDERTLSEAAKLSMLTCLNQWPWDAEQRLSDWLEVCSKIKPKKQTLVWKWVPGDHYHVLNERFATLLQAKSFLAAQGYAYEGFRTKHVYTNEGD